MKMIALCVCVTLFIVPGSMAIPKPEEEVEKPDRVISKPLSHLHHVTDEEHNVDYDHEAFLGEEEAREFDQLSPEESKSRLRQIIQKIDSNGDKVITEDELKAWIQYTQRKYIDSDVFRQWVTQVPEGDFLEWEAYRKNVYGFMQEVDSSQVSEADDDYAYIEMMNKDKRRFNLADADKDGKLSREEYRNFLHPEDAEHMKDIIITETMEDIDKNKDGVLSLDEYIGDMYKGDGGEEEPSWVATEREQFKEFRDTDGDGHMNIDEVKQWIMPPDYDHADAEAKHLIFESDEDKDGALTEEEIINKYDLFVGSQATDFGEALLRHDEF